MPAPDSEGNIRLSDNLSVYMLLRLLFSLRLTDWKFQIYWIILYILTNYFMTPLRYFNILKTFWVGEALDKFNKP